ncbi:MAG TPA: hypothetical protein VHX65_20625 [Pirellulales bacterium]|jgi:hypothetical protein|nr:hypothetical protein [Pirellulales bacterium]
MAQRRRGKQQQHRSGRPARRVAETAAAVERPAPWVKTAPIQYGKAVVVLEDESKNTFYFDQGAWVPYGASIAACRADCMVKELPQKVNRMTRYEIRRPLVGAEE